MSRKIFDFSWENFWVLSYTRKFTKSRELSRRDDMRWHEIASNDARTYLITSHVTSSAICPLRIKWTKETETKLVKIWLHQTTDGASERKRTPVQCPVDFFRFAEYFMFSWHCKHESTLRLLASSCFPHKTRDEQGKSRDSRSWIWIIYDNENILHNFTGKRQKSREQWI